MVFRGAVCVLTMVAAKVAGNGKLVSPTKVMTGTLLSELNIIVIALVVICGR
jgi:hypothetical protein